MNDILSYFKLSVAIEARGGNIRDKEYILSMVLQNKIIFRDTPLGTYIKPFMNLHLTP